MRGDDEWVREQRLFYFGLLLGCCALGIPMPLTEIVFHSESGLMDNCVPVVFYYE